MADCELPSIEPVLATFDAALGPLEPYFTAVFDPDSLGADELAEITATLMMGPGAIPILQGLAFAEVAIAAASLPTMPGLTPFPPVGLPHVGTGLPGWNTYVNGLALQTLILAMATVPIKLIIKTFKGESFQFPDIIVDLLPDMPASEAIAECIAEKLPMFG